jgi:[lysine-biosynthesis-protein LysW]---L-2-aminoadipate ligase
MRVALVAHHESETNLRLVEAAPPGVQAEIVRPSRIRGWLGPGDAALARLDVLRSLDGMETGSWEVGLLENDGIPVLNPLSALMATHDKLQTSRLLEAAGLPHPRTMHFDGSGDVGTVELPVVLKPRFGSWGSDVMLCTTREQLTEALEVISERPWFRTHGVLMQELIPPLGHDLRVVVSGGQVVGAVRRQAAEGEWRTNVALGAVRQHADPPQPAIELALGAAAAVGADLVGVDLLPIVDDGWAVIELNGAVEFNDEYSLGNDVFASAMKALVDAITSRPQTQLAALG